MPESSLPGCAESDSIGTLPSFCIHLKDHFKGIVKLYKLMTEKDRVTSKSVIASLG